MDSEDNLSTPKSPITSTSNNTEQIDSNTKNIQQSTQQKTDKTEPLPTTAKFGPDSSKPGLPKASESPELYREDDMTLLSEKGEPEGSSKEETVSDRLSDDSGVARILGKPSSVQGEAEKRTKPYIQYSEGASQASTPKNENTPASHKDATLSTIPVRARNTEGAVLEYGELSTGVDKLEVGKKPAESLATPESRQAGVEALGAKVLVVEDEPFIGDLYRHALTKAGFTAEIISDGQTGLEKAKTGVYDFVLLDIVVPQMLGLDVLAELKKIPGFKSKIIITTNLEQDDESRAAVEALADGYLIKAEITPTELANFLKTL